MRTREELDQLWQALPELPRGRGTVRYIVARPARGIREVLETGELSPERGLHGDRWATDDGDVLCQVTLMNVHAARLVRVAEDQPLHTAGDNFLVDFDLSEGALPVGARVRMGEALLEISTEPHLGCKQFRQRFGAGALAWVNDKANRHLRLRGVNCTVLEGGMVTVGDELRIVA